MAGTRWEDDDQLLADLRDALASAGPPSPSALEAGRAAFSWRTVDAELAALRYDSLLEEAVGVRAEGAGPRTLVFEGPSLSVELELDGDRVVGQLVPPAAGRVVVEAVGARPATAEADEDGTFAVRLPARPEGAPVRLRCTTGAATVVTDWVRSEGAAP